MPKIFVIFVVLCLTVNCPRVFSHVITIDTIGLSGWFFDHTHVRTQKELNRQFSHLFDKITNSHSPEEKDKLEHQLEQLSYEFITAHDAEAVDLLNNVILSKNISLDQKSTAVFVLGFLVKEESTLLYDYAVAGDSRISAAAVNTLVVNQGIEYGKQLLKTLESDEERLPMRGNMRTRENYHLLKAVRAIRSIINLERTFEEKGANEEIAYAVNFLLRPTAIDGPFLSEDSYQLYSLFLSKTIYEENQDAFEAMLREQMGKTKWLSDVEIYRETLRNLFIFGINLSEEELRILEKMGIDTSYEARRAIGKKFEATIMKPFRLHNPKSTELNEPANESIELNETEFEPEPHESTIETKRPSTVEQPKVTAEEPEPESNNLLLYFLGAIAGIAVLFVVIRKK